MYGGIFWTGGSLAVDSNTTSPLLTTSRSEEFGMNPLNLQTGFSILKERKFTEASLVTVISVLDAANISNSEL